MHPSELDDAAGRPCPQRLPVGDDPSDLGLGAEQVAGEHPNLLAPHQAWVCQYDIAMVGTTTTDGSVYRWRRTGRPDPVATTDLPDLQEALNELSPADRSRVCTSDAGPRWMVVYSHDGDLTGVAVDGFGCRDVRLTHHPFTTPPGADDQDGAVGGLLGGGTAMLDALAVGRST